MSATLTTERPAPARAAKARADVRIGVSGWTYPPWRGNFYPEKLRQADELAYAGRQFNAIEINGTFYGLQVPKSFLDWKAATPDGFVFAVKGSRFITHILRLKQVETPLANFFASGVLALGEKLGPILWQFPPFFRYDPDRFEPFLALLPHDGPAAARLAARHDNRLRADAWLDPTGVGKVRHAVEIRNDSFRDPRFIAQLRRHNVALVTADTVEWPLLMDLAADFVYCRLHGSTELYNSGYTPAELDRWAARIEAWANGRPMRDGNFVTDPLDDHRRRDVFLFFDNTDKLKAPDDAHGLMRRLNVEAKGTPWPEAPSASA
ncbi:MAG TPA: DUF72 domain-containing protein [Devosia sp.]|nr:DUF72 domain-containing protein [Devosia sp.]